MYDFKFADVGEGLHEGVILEWHFKVGDFVKEGQLITVIETHKVNAELTAPVSGVIKKIGAQVGQVIHVGETLVLIDNGTGGEAPKVAEPQAEVSKEKIIMTKNKDILFALKKIEFNQYIKQLNFKDRFLKPMFSWSEFFRVGVYNSEKYENIVARAYISKLDLTRNSWKLLFQLNNSSYDEKIYKSIYINETMEIKKIENTLVDPRRIFQYTVIISCQSELIEIQVATLKDYEIIYENLKEFMKNELIVEKDSLEFKLNELKVLHEKNLLTEEEYQAKRKQILENY